jgi:mono/diheme cytochrome c family protein
MTARGLACCAAGLAAVYLGGGYVGAAAPQRQTDTRSVPAAPAETALVTRYCVTCHNERLQTAGLALNALDIASAGTSPEIWESVVRKLRARAMPPAGSPRPTEPQYAALVSFLVQELDRAAAENPDPGRTEPFRRLNRTEYRNAVRDLLDLDVDVADLLPRDDAGHGFDNVSVSGLSPTLMERYLAAAQKVSRLAVGSPVRAPASRTVVVPPDLTQEQHIDGLPFGTRGGTAFEHTFPGDGEYAFRVRLSRDRNENVEGLTEPHEIEISLDGERLQLFTVTPNRNRYGQYYSDEGVDRHLVVRARVRGGPHIVSATFLAKNSALVETERQPYQAHFNADRHARVQPAVRSVSVEGPFDPTGIGDTPSRRRVFGCRPANASEEADCARRILANLARRAYRRPVVERDVEPLLGFYREASADAGVDGFQAGIEMALRALLASTEFLFRIERDPEGVAPDTAYPVSDVALASRLSFFIWSAPPDDELLTAAERGELSTPAVLERQVRRMLADPRAESLATNFAGQWLHLRNLAAAAPDGRQFPDFDDNLRQSFRRETELLFAHVVREDRPVTELLTADYTFLNERLAKHYGVPRVYGDRFRLVPLEGHAERAGLLGHGSILTVTSYAHRTSPVLRGKWVLDNLLGMPPPPPPPNVPPLAETRAGATPLSMRERMVAHRANPACASCHQLMDPAGLSLEQFDAIGRWRTRDEGGAPIDAAGSLPGGQRFDGVAGLRQALASRPELFAGTLTEKLLTFGLGRGVDHRDAPAVRAILRDAARDDYRFSAIALGIARSAPFRMRRSAERPNDRRGQ